MNIPPTPWLEDWWSEHCAAIARASGLSKSFGPVMNDPPGEAAFLLAYGSRTPLAVFDMNNLRNGVLKVYRDRPR